MESEERLEELLRWLGAEQRTTAEVVEHLGPVVVQYGSTVAVKPRLPGVARAEVMAEPPDGTWALNVALEPDAEVSWPSLGRLRAWFGEWVSPPALGFPSTPRAIFTLAASQTFLSRIVVDLPSPPNDDVRPARITVSVQDMSKLA